MSAQYDFQKEWPKIRTRLKGFSREAWDLAKKTEKELARVSRKGKLHIDATALNLKREHLYRLIGKEYVRANLPASPNARLKKLTGDLSKLERDLKAVQQRMRRQKGSKKASVPKSAKKSRRRKSTSSSASSGSASN